MSYETAEKIIKSAYAAGVNSLKFNWRGESTNNKIFERVTELARSLAHGSVFQERISNSNFKFRHDREDIFIGMSNQTKVKISYDSFKPHVFQTQRAGGNHALTTKNIDKFYNHPARRITQTEIVIQAVRTSLNKHEDIEYECKLRWPEATVSIRDMVGGRIGDNLDSLENRERDTSERKSCLQAHVRLIFDTQGKAYPCCPDIKSQHLLGDINRQTVGEIFQSVAAKKLRERLKNKSAFEADPCKSCSSFESYKGFKPLWGA
jgi:radical SAM protein with 4Fe4S-binding SPASM domain